jgi:diguanylate cyclase (GGDEF)-like protein
MLFIDLDRFKYVNDTFGHAAGDAVLIEVAQRLNHALRPGDLAVRLGGDEFVILLAAPATVADGLRIAHRIIESVGSSFTVANHSVFIGASIGLSLSCAGGTPDQLLRAADRAAYQAKHEGRGRVSQAA